MKNTSNTNFIQAVNGILNIQYQNLNIFEKVFRTILGNKNTDCHRT